MDRRDNYSAGGVEVARGGTKRNNVAGRLGARWRIASELNESTMQPGMRAQAGKVR